MPKPRKRAAPTTRATLRRPARRAPARPTLSRKGGAKPAASHARAKRLTPPRRPAPMSTPIVAKQTAPRAPIMAARPQPSGAPAAAPAPMSALPDRYQQTRCVLMVRDPWWIFGYWEIRSDDEARLRERIGAAAWDRGQSILRVYDVTGAAAEPLPAQGAQDIVLRDWANNWYIHVGQPNREWVVAVGRLTAEGVFYPLVCSNRVATPRSGPSDAIDENWLSLEEDYWKLFGVAGGYGIGKSSLEVQQWWARQQVGGMSSGALFSAVSSEFAAPQPNARSFWLWMNAELIVYGATMPDAQVRIQGRAIALRPDGSFTVRYALPDGQQIIPVEATSPDQHETRTMTCTVTRATREATSEHRQPTAAH